MTLSKPEIRTLIEIYSGKESISEIAQAIGVGFKQVSKVVIGLEKKLLCKKIRQGKHVRIEMSNSVSAITFRTLLIQNKPLKLEDFLFGIRFRILSSCLYESKSTKDIALMLNVSRKSVQNILYSFINRQILKREKGEIIFQKKAWPYLYEFLVAYRRSSLNGNILWKFENEMVFEIREEKEVKGLLTGFSAYKDFGIPIRNVKYCCYLPKKKLSRTEILLHSLLQIEEDTRLLDLAVVFYTKNKLKEKELTAIAPKYDLKEKVKDFMLIIKNKEEKIITNTLPQTSKRGIHDMMKLYSEG